jgi:hypothetical protein
MKVKCSSSDCIHIKDNYCTLEEIELDRLICMDDEEVTYEDHCFECLDYSNGKESSIIKSLREYLYE